MNHKNSTSVPPLNIPLSKFSHTTPKSLTYVNDLDNESYVNYRQYKMASKLIPVDVEIDDPLGDKNSM